MEETDREVELFLTRHKALNDKQTYSHVSMIPPTGKIQIKPSEKEDFWTLYCDRLYAKKDAFVSGIAEHPERSNREQCIPVFVDVDIKISASQKIESEPGSEPEDEKKEQKRNSLYTREQVMEVIRAYQLQLQKIIFQYKPEHGICFLLEKPCPTQRLDGTISHGFHLHFPYTFMSQINQDMHLIPHVKTYLDEHHTFSSLHIEPAGSVIDKSSTKQQWLLYGSKKAKSKYFYQVTRIYNDSLSEITLDQALKDFEFINYNTEQAHDVVDRTRLDYYLPRVLSICAIGKHPVRVKEGLEIITQSSLKRAVDCKVDRKECSLPVTERMKHANELVSMLNTARSDDYQSWLDIGWILYTFGDGCQEAYDIWESFSRQTSKGNFQRERCIDYWKHMEARWDNPLKSLRIMAKIDNPAKYNEYDRRQAEGSVKQVITYGGHYDIAIMLQRKFPEEFVCADPRANLWYRYEKHRWIPDSTGVTLSRRISEDIVVIFRKQWKGIHRIYGEEDGAEVLISDDDEKKLKCISKIIAKLKDSGYKKGVLSECKGVFYNENFLRVVNRNPKLIHFTNGVLDLTRGQADPKSIIGFREGRYSDMISMSTGYDYKEYTYDHPEVVELEEILTQIFPDRNLYTYFIEYCAELLEGGNKHKQFLVHTGIGDNGKSLVMELLGMALGDYMKVVPTTAITAKSKDGAGNATPQWENIEGLRHVIFQEPSKNDAINVGALKELSGNDKFYKRDLYKSGENVDILFKLGLICNHLPIIAFSDRALWSRIRVLPYESRFPADPSEVPPTLEEQRKKKIFPRNNNLRDNFQRLRQVFMWMLVETYKRIQYHGLSSFPEKVLQANNKYQLDNDVYYQFFVEKLIMEEKASISTKDLYDVFTMWFKKAQNYRTLPSKTDLVDELNGNRKYHLSEPIRGKWHGLRERTPEDDMKEDIIAKEEDEKKKGEADKKETKEEKEEEEQNEMKEEKEEEEPKEKEEEEVKGGYTAPPSPVVYQPSSPAPKPKPKPTLSVSRSQEEEEGPVRRLLHPRK